MIIMTGIKVAIVIIIIAPHSDVWARHRYGWMEWWMQFSSNDRHKLDSSCKAPYREWHKFNWCFIDHFFLQKKHIQESRYGNIVVLPRNSKKIAIHQSSIAFLTRKLTKFLGYITPKKKLIWQAGKSTVNEDVYFLLNIGNLPIFMWVFLLGSGVYLLHLLIWGPLRRWTSWFWHPTVEAEAVPWHPQGPGWCHFCPTKGSHRERPPSAANRKGHVYMVIFVGGWEGWCRNFVWIPRMQSWVVVNTLKWLKFKTNGPLLFAKYCVFNRDPCNGLFMKLSLIYSIKALETPCGMGTWPLPIFTGKL